MATLRDIIGDSRFRSLFEGMAATVNPHVNPPPSIGQCKRALQLVRTMPMTISDANEFNRIDHGHTWNAGALQCTLCHVPMSTYSLYSSMDAPLCSGSFPETGGCSLREWNDMFAELRAGRQRIDGELRIVGIRKRVQVELPESGEEEPKRPVRRILHEE